MGAEDRRVRDAGVSSDQSEEDAISESVAIQTDETGWIRVGLDWVDATRIVAIVDKRLEKNPVVASRVMVEVGDEFHVFDSDAEPDEIMERIVYATTNEDDDEDGDDEK